MHKCSLILLILAAACNKDSGGSTPPRIQWVAVNSTMQLVTESVDRSVCPSGWTLLQEELAREGRGHLPPLQRAYVTRFATIGEFVQAAVEARPLISHVMQTLRLSVLWPCWQASETWRNEMSLGVRTLRRAEYNVELTLLHHDAYPAELHARVGNLQGGWAHPDAAASFMSYTNSVLEQLYGALPPGTVIYLANEPMATLFNGYIGGGNWPPGGTEAGKSLAQAMVNMRNALRVAGERVREAGFRPALAVNVRPLRENTNPSAALLGYVFNWWLPDALISGCVDDNFDGRCERMEPSALSLVGVTFYGTVWASSETVTFGLPSTGYPELELARPVFDFTPDFVFFGEALQTTIARYPDAEIRVAEIGFSSADEELMLHWLHRYADVAVQDMPHPSIGLHTLFSGAEFAPGEWQFHLVRGCVTVPCELTSWGRMFIETVSQ